MTTEKRLPLGDEMAKSDSLSAMKPTPSRRSRKYRKWLGYNHNHHVCEFLIKDSSFLEEFVRKDALRAFFFASLSGEEGRRKKGTLGLFPVMAERSLFVRKERKPRRFTFPEMACSQYGLAEEVLS